MMTIRGIRKWRRRKILIYFERIYVTIINEIKKCNCRNSFGDCHGEFGSMKKKSDLQLVLEEMNIYSYDDYVKKMRLWESFDYRVFEGGQEKIDALRNAVVAYYERYQNKQINGQYISVNPEKVRDDQIANYMCLFPKRSLIETNALYTYFDMRPHDCEEYDMPPNDFMKQYYRFQKIIDADIAHLYPIRKDAEVSDLNGTIIDSSVIIPIKNIADVSQTGTIERIVEDSEKFYIAFPWLYHARLDDYLEICEKHPAEFECLARTIEKIATASNEGNDLQNSVFEDLKDALVNIQGSFDRRKAELKTKGIFAAAGIALTCVPYAIKNYWGNFDPKLFSTIIGGSSLLGSKDILEKFFSLKNEGISNPYWVIWRWQNKTWIPHKQ